MKRVELGRTKDTMSNHDDMNPFDQMDEDDFFDEIDYQNHGGDAALDEYEMVCFFFISYSLFRFAFLFLIFSCFMYLFIELRGSFFFFFLCVFGDWNSLLRWLIHQLLRQERERTFREFHGRGWTYQGKGTGWQGLSNTEILRTFLHLGMLWTRSFPFCFFFALFYCPLFRVVGRREIGVNSFD